MSWRSRHGCLRGWWRAVITRDCSRSATGCRRMQGCLPAGVTFRRRICARGLSVTDERWPPHDAELVVSFRVTGAPKPAGSKASGVVTRWDPELRKRVPVEIAPGRYKTFTKDSSGQPGADWRSDVRSACSDALDVAHELLDGPLAVRMTFYGERAKSHFGTGRNAGALKSSAPAFPHDSRLPDGTKLARALEDALTKLVWSDDRRVCDLWWSRRFGKPGAVVDIFRLEATVGAEVVPLSLLEGSDQSVIIEGYGDDRLETGHAAAAR